MLKALRSLRSKQLSLLAVVALPLSAQAGQGWYLGLEGGGNRVDDQDMRIYGDSGALLVAPVPDGTNIATLRFKNGWLGGLTFGYGFANGLRPEFEMAYRENDFDRLTQANPGLITGNRNGDGSEDVTTAMANLWYDFLRDSNWHPYLGGGIGAARWNSAEIDDSDETKFAWQLGTGLAVDLSPHLTMSLDYRYLKRDDIKIGDSSSTYVKTDYAAQSAMLSLRYYFGAPAPVAPEPVAVEPVTVVPAEETAPPPPPPAPVCKQPAEGESLNLDGCKAGDTLVLRGVNFNFDKASLTLNAKTLLDQVADELTRHADIQVEVDGHTDSKGADRYNMDLSQRRADSVKAYLAEKGIDASRMTTKGFGETMPVADNNTDEGRERNRRVELKITGGGTSAGDDAPAASAVTPATPADSAAPAAEAEPGAQ